MYIHLGIHMGNIVFARSRFQLLFMNFTCLKNYCTPTHANCGLAEEWYDMSTTAPWRSDTPDECPTPFKDLGSPFFILPGLTSPTKICIDAAHTWHIGLPGCTGFMKFRILIDVDWIVFWKPKDWKRFHCIGSRSLVQTETLPGEVLECSIASCLQELHEMVFSEQEEHKHSCLLQKSIQDEIDSLCIWKMLYGLHGAWGSCYFCGPLCQEQFLSYSNWRQGGRHLHIVCMVGGWNGDHGGLSLRNATVPQFWSQLNHRFVWGSAKECANSLFDLLHYAVRCSNAFYRLLHWRGLWLTAKDNAFAAQAAQEMTDPWTNMWYIVFNS